jgi:hypothetical protein
MRCYAKFKCKSFVLLESTLGLLLFVVLLPYFLYFITLCVHVTNYTHSMLQQQREVKSVCSVRTYILVNVTSLWRLIDQDADFLYLVHTVSSK